MRRSVVSAGSKRPGKRRNTQLRQWGPAGLLNSGVLRDWLNSAELVPNAHDQLGAVDETDMHERLLQTPRNEPPPMQEELLQG